MFAKSNNKDDLGSVYLTLLVIFDIVPGSHRYRRRADAVAMDVRRLSQRCNACGFSTPRLKRPQPISLINEPFFLEEGTFSCCE